MTPPQLVGELIQRSDALGVLKGVLSASSWSRSRRRHEPRIDDRPNVCM